MSDNLASLESISAVPVQGSRWKDPFFPMGASIPGRALIFACTLLAMFVVRSEVQAAPTFALSEKMAGLQAGFHLSFTEDSVGSLTIEDIRRGTGSGGAPLAWTESKSPVPGFGFTRSVYWFHWKATNPLSRRLKYYIEIGYPVLDNLALYVVGPDGSISKKESGDMLPFSHRDMNYRNVIFIEEAPAGDGSEFYLRVQTSSSFVVPLNLWTPEEFAEHGFREDLILGIFFGTMAVMFTYNIFILVSIRDVSYVYYVGYILFWSLFLLTFNGLSFQFFWPDSVWWANNCLNLFAFVTLGFMQLFAVSYLNTETGTPVLNRIIKVLFVVSVIGAVASLVIPYAIGIRLVSLHAILTVIIMIATGARKHLQGYRPARYFLLAWTLMLVGLLVLTLRNFAVLPDNLFTRWSSQFGSALEVVILALGLADRINELKQQKLQTEREAYEARLRLAGAFARFVPDEFLKILGKDSVEEIRHGDSIEKKLTVLFADIRNFTTISEEMDSADNFQFLNAYLMMMGPIISSNRGFIDKFIGDAIMALFPEDPADAVRCAVEMRHELAAFNLIRAETGYPPIDMGIGIHYGKVMLGTVGSDARLETTVIGDTVNLSSRLESLTKVYRSGILISGEVYEAIRDRVSYRCREIDMVLVKGKHHASTIFEIYEADPADSRNCKETNQILFRKGLELYRDGNFDVARSVFTEYRQACPQDQVAQVYVSRCTKLQEKRPPGWKGIVRLRT